MDEQPEGTILIIDGAYSGIDNRDLTASKCIELVTTYLTGRDVDAVKGALEFNEDGTEVLSCPAGNSPRSCTCISRSVFAMYPFQKMSVGIVHTTYVKVF